MQTKDLFKRLRVTRPIFQAPIGHIASAELAAAVAEAGGLGHLACTWRSPVQLRELFKSVNTLTRRSYGANFVLDFPIDERLGIALECGVPVISFFWGDGSVHLRRVHAAGAVAIQVVGSIGEAKRAVDAGFDILVAQGREAGGHVRGSTGTLSLVPQVIDAVAPVPVLAAGGIADQRGVRAAMDLGAAGVWIGTRFLAAEEANIHPRYRDLILAASADDTLYSEVFDIGWPSAPHRTLKNSTTNNWLAAGSPDAPHRPGEGETVAMRGDSKIPRYFFGSPTRDTTGDIESMALYAGEGVGLVRSAAPAAAIVEELASGAFPD
ncbi:MAG TPA: nitronate monooxygenase [Steroidobacteraceae bacterium]|jgi:NAD(P)H-dependent flavin oxidoreductase YrpB (nitropropane dioxygenase family)